MRQAPAIPHRGPTKKLLSGGPRGVQPSDRTGRPAGETGVTGTALPVRAARRQVACRLGGLYPNPGGEGRALQAQGAGIPAKRGDGTRTRGGRPSLRRAGGATRSPHGALPPPTAGWSEEGPAAGDGRAHELSSARAGRAPGRKLAAKRRRPCWQTGHRVRSTPVSRCIRLTTDSGGPGGTNVGRCQV